MNSYWIIPVDPKSNNKQDRDGKKAQIQRRSPVRTEAETGVTHPRAKDLLEPPEAGEGEEGFFPSSPQREQRPADTLISEILAFRCKRE